MINSDILQFIYTLNIQVSSVNNQLLQLDILHYQYNTA